MLGFHTGKEVSERRLFAVRPQEPDSLLPAQIQPFLSERYLDFTLPSTITLP